MKKLEKLPQWAQDEIKRLEGSVAYWKQKAHEAAGDAPSNTHLYDTEIDPATGRFKPFPSLPHNSVVRFDLGGSKRQDLVWVDVSVREGQLHLNANDRIAIAPLVSNAVTIAPLEPQE